MDAPFFQEFEHDAKSAVTLADHETTTHSGEHADNLVSPRRASSLRRLMTARDYLRAHFFEDLYLDDLAATANMSAFHFSRQYRRQFGIAPLADLLEHRVIMAEHLLTTTNLDITTIATAVGFECRTTLFRQFVRARGRSPLYFRRQSRDSRRIRAAQRETGSAARTLAMATARAH